MQAHFSMWADFKVYVYSLMTEQDDEDSAGKVVSRKGSSVSWESKEVFWQTWNDAVG